MPSFLVTKQMSPALAARVLASVAGRQGASASRRVHPLTALLRLAAFFMLATAVGIVLYVRHQRGLKLEHDRQSLLNAMRAEASALTAADKEQRRRVESTLSAHAVPASAGDAFADDVKSEAALLRALALPTIYVRGPLEGLGSAARLAQLAPSSWKDAFVSCLFEPPAERTEKALRKQARAAFSRDKSAELTAHVERLDPLLQALPLLGHDWERRVRGAESAVALGGYRQLFEVAPIRAAVRAAKARQLLAVMDEPGEPGAPTELDGEKPHPVRVVLIDLATGELRLRFRRNVDPSFISPANRAEYAGAIDSCALAFDLRQTIATMK